MLLVVLNLLSLASSQTPGNLTVTNFTISPPVLGSMGCSLFLSFIPQYALPQEFVLRLNSSQAFLDNPRREDCFVTGESGVYAKSCSSQGNVLEVTVDSRNVSEITSDMKLSLTVQRAMNLEEKVVVLDVKTIWYEEVINWSPQAAIQQVEVANATFAKLNMTLAMTMDFVFTTLNVSFELPTISIRPEDRILLRFPDEFDQNVGNMKATDQSLSCTSIPNYSPICLVSFSSLLIQLDPVPTNTFLTLIIKEVRMPSALTPVQILLLSNTTVKASSTATPSSIIDPLDLSCCIRYDILNYECPPSKLLVCFAFHFNQAKFKDDMNSIEVRFKQDINISPFRQCSECQNCDRFLEPRTLRKLGSDPVCRWTDSNEFTIFLGSYPTITNRDMLYFLENKIQYANTDRFLKPSRLRLINPIKMPRPVSVIAQSGSISNCSVATLDCLQTTGTGRRNLNCDWYVEGYFRQRGPIITLGESLIPKYFTGDRLKVTLNTTNEWGEIGSAVTNVTYLANNDIKISFPFGSQTRFYYSQDFSFFLSLEIASSCPISNIEDSIITWSFSDPQQFPNCTDKRCVIPRRSTAVGNYTLTVSAFLPDTLLKGNSTVSFEIVPMPLKILTVGGNRLVRVNSNVTIYGNRTRDPDNDRAVNLQWVVKNSIGEQVYPEANSSYYGYNFFIPNNVLSLPKARYTVYVSTTLLSKDRNVNSELWLDTTPEPTYSIFTLPPPTVNPFDIVKISAESYVPKNSTCNWCQTETNHNYKSLSDPHHPIFVFEPESFDVGLKYKFQYECLTVEPGGQERISRAEVEIYVNMPPVGGVFNLDPKEGVELVTTFALVASNWQDSELNYPLYYQYYNYDGKLYRPFTPAMLQNDFSTVLAGVSQYGTQQAVVLYVCDTLHACTRSTQFVTLSQSHRNSSRLAQETLDSALNLTRMSGDPRAALTTAGQLSLFLKESLKKNNMTAEQVTEPLAAIVDMTRDSLLNLTHNNTDALSTADQETFAQLVANAMIPQVANFSLVSQGLEILSSALNLTNTRYTAASIYAASLDSVQQAMVAYEAEVEERLQPTEDLYAFRDKLVQQIAGTLTPGQFPTNITQPTVNIFVSRWQGDTGPNSGFNRTLEFEIHYGNLEGYYRLNLANYNFTAEQENQVIQVIVSTMLSPPSTLLLYSHPHKLCEYYFANSDDYSTFASSEICLNYTITTEAELTTVYSNANLKSLPYQNNTGQLGDGVLAELNYGQVTTHVIPMAFYEGEVTCAAHSSEGLLEACSKGEATSTSVECNCMSASDAFLMPGIEFSSLADPFTPLEVDMSDCYTIWAGTLFMLLVAWVFFRLWHLFKWMDLEDEPAREKIIEEFYKFVKEAVEELSKWNGTVKWWSHRDCKCFCLVGFCVRRCYKPKIYSLLTLFSNFAAGEKDSEGKLALGIKDAMNDLKKNPILKRWNDYGVVKSFCARLSCTPFLKHVTALFFQFKLEIRVTVQSDALGAAHQHDALDLSQRAGALNSVPEGYGPSAKETRARSLFTDDLIFRKSYWSIFVDNNELLGMIFNRKIAISRSARFPIFMVTFLTPLLFYSANINAYNSPTRKKLLSLTDLIEETKFLIWKDPNWLLTGILFVMSLVITTITEKLLVWFSPYFQDVDSLVKRFPVHRRKGGSVSRCLKNCCGYLWGKCSLALQFFLFRWLSVMICLGLYLFSFNQIWNMDTNNTLLVLTNTIISFAIGGVMVGFIAIPFVLTLMCRWESMWMKLYTASECEWAKSCAVCCKAGSKVILELIQPIVLLYYLVSDWKDL